MPDGAASKGRVAAFGMATIGTAVGSAVGSIVAATSEDGELQPAKNAALNAAHEKKIKACFVCIEKEGSIIYDQVTRREVVAPGLTRRFDER